MKWKMKIKMLLPMAIAAVVLFGIFQAAPASAGQVVAWTGQSGPGGKFTVLFDGKIYTNRWWADSFHCPADAGPDNWVNPWQYKRDATADEMKNLDNPTTCDAAGTNPGGGSTGGGSGQDGTFDQIYAAGDIVTYKGKDYKARRDTQGVFAPGEGSVWQLYVKPVSWLKTEVYLAGDYVKYEGEIYMAQWWTLGDIPTENIGDGVNGKVWLPKPDFIAINPDDARPFDASMTYSERDVIEYKGKIYVARRDIQAEGISPDTTNPWMTYINWTGVKAKVGESPGPWPKHVFAPYIDASLGYVPNLAEFKKDTGTGHFVLAFLVNTDCSTCSYAWGGVSSVKDGPSGLYSKIKALRRTGGDVMVSIGGANNNPLAKACTDVEELKNHYKNIIDNLNLAVLDFDIEGGHVADTASIKRRSQALKMLQDELAKEGRDVPIWITLPVLPSGLTADGVNVVRSAMEHGVKLSGINLMTMDYGGAMGCQSVEKVGNDRRRLDPTKTINGDCDIAATRAVHGQIKSLARNFNLNLSDDQIWNMLGATPMIGVNDQELEVFFLDDAKKLRAHAEDKAMGLLSIWSVARDRAAPAGQAWQVSPEHSGLTADEAGNRAFSMEFALFDPANPSSPAPTPAPTPDPPAPTPPPTPAPPETSTYPPYKTGVTYKAGDKVSNNGNIYQCKPWPYSGWCSGSPAAYEPGVGRVWDSAWTQTD